MATGQGSLTGLVGRVFHGANGRPRVVGLEHGVAADEHVRPGSFRSVGAALRACPTPLLVPTHRIVTATGKPTDDINAALLKLEQQPLTR